MKPLFTITFAFFLIPFAFAQQYVWVDISDNVPQNNEFPPNLSDVFFVTDNVGWITASDYNEIYYTTDGGLTFSTQTTPLGATSAIHMLDESNGYSGGQGGWVYKTTNGGQNWVILASMGTLLDISFPFGASPSNPVGYGSGNSGNVWEITSTLTNLNSPSSSTLSGISAPSINNVWVCGAGRIYYYNGNDFTSQTTPGGTFNDIQFIDNHEGWVVGDYGVIGNTEDGGNLWITQVNPDTQNRSLYGVFFLDSDLGWAVGSDGIILETKDGGTTWELVAEGITTAFLRSVQFTSPINGYIVGNDKTLLKYTELTGISDQQMVELDFELYPNPCTDKIQIANLKIQKKLKTQNSKLYIIDLFGKVVYEEEMRREGEGEICVDVSDLMPGIYFVKLQTDGAVGVRKIIIK